MQMCLLCALVVDYNLESEYLYKKQHSNNITQKKQRYNAGTIYLTHEWFCILFLMSRYSL